MSLLLAVVGALVLGSTMASSGKDFLLVAVVDALVLDSEMTSSGKGKMTPTVPTL